MTKPLAQSQRAAAVVPTYTRFTIQRRPWRPGEAGPWIFPLLLLVVNMHIGARGSIVD